MKWNKIKFDAVWYEMLDKEQIAVWYEMLVKEQIAVWYEMLDEEQIIYLAYPAQVYRKVLKNVWTRKSMIGE